LIVDRHVHVYQLQLPATRTSAYLPHTTHHTPHTHETCDV
jgi:hypothetical protein